MKKIVQNTFLYLLLAVGLFASAHLLYESGLMSSGIDGPVKALESTLAEKEDRTEELLNEISQTIAHRPFETAFEDYWDHYPDLFEQEGIAIFSYVDDSLEFWTTHKVPLPDVYDPDLTAKRVVRLQNGIYEVMHFNYEGKTWVGAILIRHDYPFENDHLRNDFQQDFKGAEGSRILLENYSESTVVRGRNGEVLFGLEVSELARPPTWKYFVLVLMNVAAMLLLFLFFHRVGKLLSRRIGKFYATIIVVVVMVGLRVLSLTGIEWSTPEGYTTIIPPGFPFVFSDLDLFSPTHYAESTLLPSLGDLLVNTLLILVLAWYVHRQFPKPYLRNKATSFGAFFNALLILLGLHWWSMANTNVVRGLIENSSINFEVNNLFSLDWYSYIGILVICMLFLAYFLLANKLIESIHRSAVSGRQLLLLFLAVTVAYIVVSHQMGVRDLILVLWPSAVLGTIIFSHYRRESRFDFSTVILLLGIFSFFASHSLAKFSKLKEQGNRKVFAAKLASDEDPVAEWEYPSLERKLERDALKDLVFDAQNRLDKTDFDFKLQSEYFTDYWDKYEVKSYIFGPDSLELGVSPSELDSASFEKLERNIRLYGSPSELSPNLIYIQNANKKLSYIIKLPLAMGNRTYGFLFFELTSKLIPEELGFPALLLDRNTRNIDDLSKYSYARYVDKRLIAPSSGSYPYPLSQSIFESLKGEPPFYDFDGYNHLFHQVPDHRTLIILSKPQESVLGQFTAFSYIFAFFSILLLLVIFFRNFPEGLRIEQLQLKTKIQLLIVLVLLSSLILFVMGTRYYIEEQYQTKNRNLISEKINSVQIEVRNKLGGESVLDASKEELMTRYLKKFSRVFFTDINLYALDGELLASSRGKIFDEGLISRHMSPEAFVNIGLHEKSKFIFEEEIGNMRYLSAYVPFRNDNDEILAYLNLPYFAKQDELESEISAFLVAIINIFVLLFGFSIVAALFVSNWITKPLRLLQESLAGIKLGQYNKTIEYKGSDEIGALVKEYNKMVQELEYNTMRLTRSERESAWREMAKQVAHEIKNPLTPIKLRAQHLQMSFDPKGEDSEERLKAFTDMLIEQIDTLTSIANEFSNFAKMPKAKDEKLDIVHLLQSSVELYKDAENCEVIYESTLAGAKYILADRDQLIRVFNNLIKNGLQAIPDSQEGQIKVILTLNENGYKVEVKDNGTGIPDEQQDKIFQPSFTTKNTGMGLGLAMVKQIVENANGRVYFTTKPGQGTSFFVELPVYEEGQ